MASVLSPLKRWPFVPGGARFRKLWAAESISVIGSQVSLIAFPLAAILLLNAGTVEVGFVSAAERVPYLLFGLLAGVFVDRWNHRVVMIAADWIRAAVIILIPLLAWAGHLSILLMCVVVFVAGVATVFFDIAYQSILTSVVDERDLLNANRLLETSSATAQVAGPGLAAVLLRVMSAPYAIAVDALSFAFSALFLHSIGKVRIEPEESSEAPSIRREILQGLAFIRHNKYLRWIATIAGSWNLLIQGVITVFFVFMSQELKLSASTIAVVVFFGTIGGVAGIAVMGRINAWFGAGPTVCIATVSAAIGGIVMALADSTPLPPAIVIGAAYFLMNAGFPLFDVNVITIRQTITPRHLMSRTTAAIRTIIWGALPIGAVIGGFLGAALGTRTAIVVLGVALLVPAALTVISPISKVRNISDLSPSKDNNASNDDDNDPDETPEPTAVAHPVQGVDA
ncbi:MFS transporter [Actinoplanes sp. HUAS TT8]|uniref:MFS transporter n=1 Tax=Actinoplanes sp. HUAS TT8 TaxID=3447453 RepID=UPI003F520174